MFKSGGRNVTFSRDLLYSSVRDIDYVRSSHSFPCYTDICPCTLILQPIAVKVPQIVMARYRCGD